MKVHLIVAHPEQNSFNHGLYRTALEYFKEHDIACVNSDLYQMQFDAIAGPNDMPSYQDEGFFQLAPAQRWATQNQGFESSIALEQQKLVDADVVIFQFPLWWWSFPAILKGWIDRVLSSGFAYGKDSQLKAKRVMYSVTTGGARNQEERDYYDAKIAGLYQDIFGFMGWQCLTPFIAHGVQQASAESRKTILADFKAHLSKEL